MIQTIARELARLFAAVAMLFLPASARAEDRSLLNAPQAYEMIAAGKATLIDIRRPTEWRETGVAKGALRIDMAHPQGVRGFAQQVLDTVGGNLDAPIVLICRSGNRTAYMQAALTQFGFKKVFHVSGGMLGSWGTPGWVAQGLPVTPCPQC